MHSRETLKKHAELVDRMANRVGVDLEDAAIRGDVSIDQISDAVLRCTGCANPDHCQSLLNRAEMTGNTPEYCRNKPLFNQLIPASDR